MSVASRPLASLLVLVILLLSKETSVIIGTCFLALGLTFVPLKAEGWAIPAVRFHFNIYTGPGYLGGLLGVVNILLLVFLFWERKLPKESRIEDKPMRKVLRCEYDTVWCPLSSFAPF